MSLERTIERLIANNKLPAGFVRTVENFYLPLANKILHQADKTGLNQDGKKPLFIGIQGTQGSGKSTCAEFLDVIFTEKYSKRCLVSSIDDFYLTRSERQQLASEYHPLFSTRGVPGTHDIALLEKILAQCADRLPKAEIRVPVFDKSIDDRAAESQWQLLSEPVDIIILEGWCVGVPPQSQEQLHIPVNSLESEEDPDGVWRSYVNKNLSEQYQHLFDQMDYLIALQAPSFECVYQWRLLQEQKLAAKLAVSDNAGSRETRVQSEQELLRFISHYERLTRHALKTMPTLANWLLMLNQDHSFSELMTNHV